ncbi:MAG: 3-deoxy-D-manno-octulosonic acid transferase [Proteobacteria bacterium]|nr:3-deoxy-D-manno-octulosonic acid transferase [Pseudomonadota bacterium]
MIFAYRTLQIILSPLLLAFIAFRVSTGKEDKVRIKERLGIASVERDFSKKLIWLHCASVGESLSVLPMIQDVLDRHQDALLMITTGTVTSAELMAERLPERAFHQYVPIDCYYFVKRFVNYWKPDLSIIVESELWPNLIMLSPNKIMINGRMSDRSFKKYKKVKKLTSSLLNEFECIFAQSDQDFDRLSYFTGSDVKLVNSGNLKYDGPALEFKASEAKTLKQVLADKKMLVAASTHEEEEKVIIELYKGIKKEVKDLFLILVPRHPNRGGVVAKIVKNSKLTYRQRSDNKNLESLAKLDVYLADTLGEMGLWYELADAVVMGGSIAPYFGGHNPLEPLKSGKATITGAYMYHFKNMSDILVEKGVLEVCKDKKEMEKAIIESLNDKSPAQFAKKAKSAVESLTGATEIILEYIKNRIQ